MRLQQSTALPVPGFPVDPVDPNPLTNMLRFELKNLHRKHNRVKAYFCSRGCDKELQATCAIMSNPASG
jgi:hypothetical protein